MTNLPNQDSGNHYRKVYKGVQLDPYRIYDIYGVTDPAAQQAIKKCLAAGKRGIKSFKQDLIEARDALDRRIEMLEEDAVCMKASEEITAKEDLIESAESIMQGILNGTSNQTHVMQWLQSKQKQLTTE